MQDNAVVLNSIILGVQKCLETFGGFLNPFYESFVTGACLLTTTIEDDDDDKKNQATKNRLKHLCATISKSIPTQKLVDIATQVYDELMADSSSSKPIVALSLILRENLSQLVSHNIPFIISFGLFFSLQSPNAAELLHLILV